MLCRQNIPTESVDTDSIVDVFARHITKLSTTDACASAHTPINDIDNNNSMFNVKYSTKQYHVY